jgi:hypothetical protein
MAKLRLLALIGALSLWGLAGPAFGQTHVGVRAGVSASPNQFFAGMHLETEPLLPRVTFRPNLEVGVGDGLSLATINLEFVYTVDIDAKPWKVYIGGGPAAVISAFHAGHPRRPDRSDVGGGFNLLVGAQHDQGLFVELKVGALDSPSAKFTVGYAFR